MSRTLFIVAVLALASVALAHRFVVHDELIGQINTSGAKWKAAHNRFSYWTEDEVKGMLGTYVRPHLVEELAQAPMASSVGDVPAAFDSRTQWGSCIHPVRDQAKCGSCWAFSASEVLSDRFCIASKGAVDVVLSPQALVSCDHTNMGCNGGMLPNTWAYLVKTGIVADACMPYTSGDGSSSACPSKCADGSAMKYYKAASYTHFGSLLFPHKRVQEIQTEIMTNGPVQGAFTVYSDFMSYQSGVYHHVSGGILGGHAIKIVGWGSDATGGDYWIVQNSWGPSWGENGFFRIVRGKDECGIEGQVYAGPAAL